MQRKKRCDQRARPAGVCCSQQKPEDKQCVCRMDQGVNEQMATCVQAEQLAVDHVCDPCERMPVYRIKRSERPAESREGNTAIHHWVVLDIHTVIERDELMSDHLRINGERHNSQGSGDEEIHSTEQCSLTMTGCGRSFASEANATSLSFSRRVFSHSVKETVRPQTAGHQTKAHKERHSIVCRSLLVCYLWSYCRLSCCLMVCSLCFR